VAFADATYGGIAAFGLAALASVLVGARVVLGLIGGAFLLYLGWRTMTSRPREAATAADRPGLLAAAVSIYGLTMTNPMTILSFAAVFAGLGIVADTAVDAALVARRVVRLDALVGDPDGGRGGAALTGDDAGADVDQPRHRRADLRSASSAIALGVSAALG
jgi:hypothetical protein